jgi:hypothetical protein
MSEQNAEKPLQFSLRMLLLITALIASIVACIVAWNGWHRNMKSIWLMQNGPAIKEVERWQEEHKRYNNGKSDPHLDEIIERLKNGGEYGEAR